MSSFLGSVVLHKFSQPFPCLSFVVDPLQQSFTKDRYSSEAKCDNSAWDQNNTTVQTQCKQNEASFYGIQLDDQQV
jgi:hypothetical protein